MADLLKARTEPSFAITFGDRRWRSSMSEFSIRRKSTAMLHPTAAG